jgi:phosphotransferase system enzyme I (PtsI)
VRGLLRQVKTGDPVIVDGRGGHVLVHPDAEQRSAYLKLERDYFLLRDQLAASHRGWRGD